MGHEVVSLLRLASLRAREHFFYFPDERSIEHLLEGAILDLVTHPLG